MFFVVPMLLNLIFPGVALFGTLKNGMDVLMVYSIGIVLAVLLKLGDEKTVLKDQVPWNTIMLVGGCATLVAVCSAMGMGEYLSGLISSISNTALIAPVMAVVSGLVSLVSDSTAVVFPLFFPAVSGISAATGITATKLFSCIMTGAILAGIAPISSGGSMNLSFVKKERRNKVFLMLWIYCLCLIVVLGLITASPLVA